jgi:hypothetical protein
MSAAVKAKQVKKCIHGHLKTPDNVYSNGACKTCVKNTASDQYWSNRDEIMASERQKRRLQKIENLILSITPEEMETLTKSLAALRKNLEAQGFTAAK